MNDSGVMLEQPFASRVTLRFVPPLEARFLAYYCRTFRGTARTAFGLALFLYVAFAAIDALSFPGGLVKALVIRFGLVCPVLIAGIALTYSRWWERHFEEISAVMIAVASFGILSIIVATGQREFYFIFGGIPLCLMFAFTYVRVRYLYIVATCALVTVVFIAIAIRLGLTPDLIVRNGVALVAANLIGGYACYSHEYFVRKSYVQSLVIEQRQRQLEQSNAGLAQANRELAESREEILRSSRRAELIFNVFNDALPGTVLDDKYRIESQIGSGGFGTVYRATQLLLSTTVAIKVFKPVPGHDAKRSLDRFRAEGVSAFKVAHPNAVRVLDFAVSMDSVAYLVMEYLEGESLDQLMKREGALSAQHVAAILQPVCEALAHAHAAGVIHRDVKPSNILLCRGASGEGVKLIDFGIAKMTGDGDTLKNLTATGLFMGTPNYMAPERFLDKPCDGKSDVYSVGIIAYEMLAGTRPFTESGENYLPVAMQHIHDAPGSLDDKVPGVPPTLADLVSRTLAKNPAHRPSAAELARHFAMLLDSQEA